MQTTIERVLSTVAQRYSDQRFHVFEVKITEMHPQRVVLAGRVLEEENRTVLRQSLLSALPDLQVEDQSVKVLRGPAVRRMAVATNLTSLQAQPAWQSEQLNQLLAGQSLEILQEQEIWGYVRQADGYLGWAYLPYLTPARPLSCTHLVTAPCVILRSEPEEESAQTGRILGGTLVTRIDIQEDWAWVTVFDGNPQDHPAQIRPGWMPLAGLRSLEHLPQTADERRNRMVADAQTLIGVPYLWGGSSANGIDCSGFAQLLHRWVGISIPRDADSQFLAGKPVEPPFQPGDLLFFGEKDTDQHITHVGVSTGGWNILHSSRRRNGVGPDDVQLAHNLRDSYLCACSYL